MSKWNVLTSADGTLWIQGEPDANGFRTICTLPNKHFASTNHDKNAALISAAPELLASMEQLVERATESGFGTTFEPNRIAIQTAIAAIAKARGIENNL